MTIHDFDMARFLLGEVVEVHAVGANLVDHAAIPGFELRAFHDRFVSPSEVVPEIPPAVSALILELPLFLSADHEEALTALKEKRPLVHRVITKSGEKN